MIDGFSFGVIPASHHPRVVCLSALRLRLQLQKRSRSRSTASASVSSFFASLYLARHPCAIGKRRPYWALYPYWASPVGAITFMAAVLHAGNSLSIRFASGTWQHGSRQSVLLSSVAASWIRVNVLQPAPLQEHLSLTMASPRLY